MKSAAAARTAVCAGRIGNEKWSDGRVARQRSAKPCTAVRVRFRPHRNCVVDVYSAVSVLGCHALSCMLKVESDEVGFLQKSGHKTY